MFWQSVPDQRHCLAEEHESGVVCDLHEFSIGRTNSAMVWVAGLMLQVPLLSHWHRDSAVHWSSVRVLH